MTHDEFQSLLMRPESTSLDWKAGFPPQLVVHAKGVEWEKGKAALLKDLTSLANSEGGG